MTTAEAKPYRATIVVDPPIPVSFEPPPGYVALTTQALKDMYPAGMFREDFEMAYTACNRATRRAAKRGRR